MKQIINNIRNYWLTQHDCDHWSLTRSFSVILQSHCIAWIITKIYKWANGNLLQWDNLWSWRNLLARVCISRLPTGLSLFSSPLLLICSWTKIRQLEIHTHLVDSFDERTNSKRQRNSFPSIRTERRKLEQWKQGNETLEISRIVSVTSVANVDCRGISKELDLSIHREKLGTVSVELKVSWQQKKKKKNGKGNRRI